MYKFTRLENIFHDIQETINEKKLKIPETVDTQYTHCIIYTIYILLILIKI